MIAPLLAPDLDFAHLAGRPHPPRLLRLRGGDDEISTARCHDEWRGEGKEGMRKGNRARGRGSPGVSGSSRRAAFLLKCVSALRRGVQRAWCAWPGAWTRPRHRQSTPPRRRLQAINPQHRNAGSAGQAAGCIEDAWPGIHPPGAEGSHPWINWRHCPTQLTAAAPGGGKGSEGRQGQEQVLLALSQICDASPARAGKYHDI